jgi:hypothetical protein
MGDEEFVEKKRSDRLYLSKTFRIGREGEHELRYITRVFDEADRSAFDTVDDEIVLRSTHNDKIQIKAVVTTDSHKVKKLILQSFRLYKKEGWQPNEQYGISLSGDEIQRLLDFVKLASNLDVPVSAKVRIDDASLAQFDLDDTARRWIAKNPEALADLAASQITSRDVVAVGYRKRQLQLFERMLEDHAHFDTLVAAHQRKSKEGVWQDFFERNRWIFGYGLFHLSVDGFENKKLEQIVAGATGFSDGKRADALLRTRGRISSLCFVEIKHHESELLAKDKYRSGAWQPSTELTGAVAQTLATVDGAERQFQQFLYGRDRDGNPTGEDAAIARPRAVIICGSLNEFVADQGVNHAKFRSFELFRRHLNSPDIVTFDELFERARLIADNV